MRTIYLFASFALFSMIINAQEFELTANGFQSGESDYLVLEYPEKSQEELYNKTLAYLHTLYKDPKEALSTLDNESITITGHASNQVRRNNFHIFDLDYTWVIRFKDGKVRFDAPDVTMRHWYEGDWQLLLVNLEKGGFMDTYRMGIYKKGKLKIEKAKADLEHYFNAILKDYSNSFLTDNDW
jgi:hypothetical protein